MNPGGIAQVRKAGPGVRLAPLIAAALAVVCAMATLPQATAQEPSEEQRERLREVERQIREGMERQESLERRAREMAQQIEDMRARLRAHAEQAAAMEARLAVLDGELAELNQREARMSDAFRARQQQLARVLATLQQLRSLPRATVAALPGGPNTAVRTVLVLRAVTPHLEITARDLRDELSSLSSLQREIEGRQAEVRNLHGQLYAERQEIAALLSRRSELLQQTEVEKEAMLRDVAALQQEARSIRELLEGLERNRQVRERSRTAALTRPSGLRRFEEARGKITLPAVGRIVTRFGADSSYGQPSRGIEIETRAGAQIVAPYDGQVVFAGPFRTYGQILIIEHSDGYHSLIAGLSRIDVAIQQWVLAGEPIGSVTIGDAKPRVYLELRQHGRPINPLPWLAADRLRNNG